MQTKNICYKLLNTIVILKLFYSENSESERLEGRK